MRFCYCSIPFTEEGVGNIHVCIICGGVIGPLNSEPKKEIKPMNSMMILTPYWTGGTWAFDDKNVGLKCEPFVLGIPEIMDDMLKTAKIEKKDVLEGFKLIFSAEKFPGYHKHLTWVSQEGNGNWYKCGKKVGWLCPALFKYFPKAPKNIYARAEKL